MNITKTMTLELTRSLERSKTQYISTIQGDNGSRYVKITLTNDGESYHVPKGVSANFRAQKPDGTMVLNQAVVNDDGTVTVELTQQTLAVCGDVIADIYLTDGNGSILSSVSFVIQVEAAPMGDKIDSENEFLIFTALTEQAEHAAVQAKQFASDATMAAERATQAAIQAKDKLPLAGGTMKGSLDMGGQTLTGLQAPVNDTDAVPKNWVVPKTGGTMKGPLDMGGQALTGLKDPAADMDALSLGAAKERFTPKEGGHYVLDAGESGGWYYRKWEDGFAECWTKNEMQVTGSSPSSMMGGYLTTATVQLPISFAAGKTNTVLNAKTSTGVGFGYGVVLGGNQLKIYCTGNANTADIRYQAYLIGRWK